MTQYLISFNQQWVGDHSSEWFQSRGPLARAVVADMAAAGVLVFAEGVGEEPELAWRDEAKMWAARVAVACGWTQELRSFKG